MIHQPQLRRYHLSVFVVLLLFTTLLAIAQQKDSESKNPIPLESLLNGPDRADMPWKVQFSDPRLMYLQQYLLEIKTTVPAEMMDVGGIRHVLHFMAKVQDSNGHWLEGEQYNRFEPTAELGNTKVIQCDMAIYLRPGEYTVAMIAYDSASKQANILRRKIVVHPIAGDPIPELNSHVPLVEFPSDFPQEELSRTDRSDGELFPISQQFSPIEIANRDPIRIDIVLNVSRQNYLPVQPARGPSPLDRDYDGPFPSRRSRNSARTPQVLPSELALGRALQVSSVLSRISPLNGCVFVTAIDPIRMQVPFPAKPSSQIDWVELQKDLTKSDQSMIDARVLQNHKGPGLFLRDTLQQLASPNSTCGTGPAPASHLVAIVGATTNLPGFSKEMRLSDVTTERARFYYFHVRNDSPFPDDVGKVLNSAKTKRLGVNDPESFRRALASFISDLRLVAN